MSFAGELKTELTKINLTTCCSLAECYGLFLFSNGPFFTAENNSFNKKNTSDKIKSVTEKSKNNTGKNIKKSVEEISEENFEENSEERLGNTFKENFKENFNINVLFENQDVAELLISLSKKIVGVNFKLTVFGNKKDIFALSLNCSDSLKVIDFFGKSNEHGVIKYHNISDDCCKTAFLRGAFLACGYMDNPDKDYNLEFVINNPLLASEFSDFLKEFNLKFKKISRKGSVVLYLKDSALIEDFLAIIGAADRTLELAGIKVYKDMRNHYNRINNCETANIGKTVNSSLIQRKAISALKQADLYDSLSDELKEAAVLRLKKPDAPLSKLCKTKGCNLSRSGLNHRLCKLVSLAKEKNLI